MLRYSVNIVSVKNEMATLVYLGTTRTMVCFYLRDEHNRIRLWQSIYFCKRGDVSLGVSALMQHVPCQSEF